MPADKYNFAPSQAIFVPSEKVDFSSPKSVNTFGQTVAHIAQANYYFFSTLGGAKPDVDMKAMGNLTSKDDAVKALEGSFAYAHKQLGDVDGGECVCVGEGRSDEDEHGGVWDRAYVRPLWADGGVSADERDCASGQPEAVALRFKEKERSLCGLLFFCDRWM